MKYITILFIFILGSAQAQFRSYSNEFLNIGVGARAFAMGNAVVASTHDVHAGYWNPAGLTQIGDRWQASAMHASYFESIANYDYLAAAIPLENQNVLGVSLFRFGVDNILNTTELIDSQGNIDYDRVSSFSASDYALLVSYAGNFFDIPNVNFGLNAKLVYRNVGKFANSYGFGLDAGMQYINRGFSAGVMVRDITTTFNAWQVNEDELNQLVIDGVTLNEPPEETLELTLPKIQLGIAQKIDVSEQFTLQGELDLEFRLRENNQLVSGGNLSFSPNVGLELGYNDMIFVRTGINNVQRIEDFEGKQKIDFQPNVGLGFKYNGISVDYALTNIGSTGEALYSNIFSLKIDMAEFYY